MGRLSRYLLTSRFSRFALVGASGFVIDALVLLAGLAAGLDPFTARLIAVLAAMSYTWLLNRSFTFGASPGHPLREWLRYMVANGAGGAVNYGIYSLLLLLFAPALTPLVALCIASVLAMLVNYWSNGRFVFTGARHSES